jgi:hypothetical protein
MCTPSRGRTKKVAILGSLDHVTPPLAHANPPDFGQARADHRLRGRCATDERIFALSRHGGRVCGYGER